MGKSVGEIKGTAGFLLVLQNGESLTWNGLEEQGRGAVLSVAEEGDSLWRPVPICLGKIIPSWAHSWNWLCPELVSKTWLLAPWQGSGMPTEGHQHVKLLSSINLEPSQGLLRKLQKWWGGKKKKKKKSPSQALHLTGGCSKMLWEWRDHFADTDFPFLMGAASGSGRSEVTSPLMPFIAFGRWGCVVRSPPVFLSVSCKF